MDQTILCNVLTFIYISSVDLKIMDESLNQQYALQVAVQTMKERCLQLQQRLSLVEEENTQLRVKHNVEFLELSDPNNRSEIEMLREKVAQLTKQKSQLTHNVLMVATENRHLWKRLSKLTQANQTLGNQLSKISDSMNQNSPQTTTNLIRSRTFTHETPPKIVPKIDKEVYIDTSLEDISLKILNNIAQEKSELEKQCAQMAEITTNMDYLQNSIGFAYLNEESDDFTSDLTQHAEKLKYIKDMLLIQRDKLKNNEELFRKLKGTGLFCSSCKKRSKEKLEKGTTTETETKKKQVDINISHKSSKKHDEEHNEQICPICCADLSLEKLPDFLKHVEQHFVTDDKNYLEKLNYEFL